MTDTKPAQTFDQGFAKLCGQLANGTTPRHRIPADEEYELHGCKVAVDYIHEESDCRKLSVQITLPDGTSHEPDGLTYATRQNIGCYIMGYLAAVEKRGAA